MKPLKNLSLALSFIIFGACTTEDVALDPNKPSVIVKHEKLSGTCTDCHEKARPAVILGVAHGEGKNCGECHNSSDELNGWRPPKPYSHVPAPTACMGCHGMDRPKRADHPAEGDCAGCHAYPSWKAQ